MKMVEGRIGLVAAAVGGVLDQCGGIKLLLSCSRGEHNVPCSVRLMIGLTVSIVSTDLHLEEN